MKRLAVLLAVVTIALVTLAPVPVEGKGGGAPSGGSGGTRAAAPAPPRTTTTTTRTTTTKTTTTKTSGTTAKTAPAGGKVTINTKAAGPVTYTPRSVPRGSSPRYVGSTVYYVSPHYGWYGHSAFYGYPYHPYYWNCWGCYGQPYWGSYYVGGMDVAPTPAWVPIGFLLILVLTVGLVAWRVRR